METTPPSPPLLLSELLPRPARISTEPPALLSAEVSPATRRTLPPSPVSPAPTIMFTSPPAPCAAVPVETLNAPESPLVLLPVKMSTDPETPATPASAVRSKNLPLEVCLENPVCIYISPPVLETLKVSTVVPLVMLIFPARPNVPLPTVIEISPACPL